MSKMVGMSRNISFEQLDKAFEYTIKYDSEEKIKEALNEYLALDIKSPTNIRKTRDILMTIWTKNYKENSLINSIAIRLMDSNKKIDRLVSHWCKIISSYDIFKDIAETIGKLDDKQIDLTARLIKDKILNLWGERQTLVHTIPKNIKTMKDIDVLEQIKKGKYRTKKYKVKNKDSMLLIIATIINLNKKLYLNIDEVSKDEMMFPFVYETDLEYLQKSNLFLFDRIGGEIVISLKE